jgi:hypothetical protein
MAENFPDSPLRLWHDVVARKTPSVFHGDDESVHTSVVEIAGDDVMCIESSHTSPLFEGPIKVKDKC